MPAADAASTRTAHRPSTTDAAHDIDRAAIDARVRVPSVISTTDHDILLDPRQKGSFSVASWARIPFNCLIGTAT